MRKKYMSTVYIMANKRNGVLFTGVTNDIVRAVSKHKCGEIEGISKQHGCKQLVYYKIYGDILSAIAEKNRMKKESRKRKLSMIEMMNPNWKDLYDTLL